MTNEQYLKNLSVPTGMVDAVIDTDTFNEIDHQFAVSFMLLSKERINAKAIYAAPYGKKVIINPAPVYDIPQELLKYTDLLILNEHEASILTNIDVGMDNAAVAAGILCRLGVSEVLITFGRSGSAYFNGNTACIVPAYHVKSVDTTAAGDTYTAAFIIKYNECGDIEESMKFASAASAIVVTRLGASVSIPARVEVDRFLAEQGVR